MRSSGRETREQVRSLIDQLPTDYRTVLLLRDIEGLDTKETAELLGVTPNAAKIRLHRARLALRTCSIRTCANEEPRELQRMHRLPARLPGR